MITRLHLMPSLRMGGAMSPLPHMPLWYVRVKRYLFLLKEILQILFVG